MRPDSLAQPCRGNAAVDSGKTQGKAIADFHVESTSGSEALLASAENSKASSNVGVQTPLTATCSSDHLDAEHSKYDTGDKISRQTSLSKSKKPEAINSVALPYEDQMCNTDLNVKDDLARHTKTRGTKRSFKCEACGREFSRSDDLRRHERIHTGECPFQCHVCKHKFRRLDYLKNHIKTHTNERSFKCTTCDKSFIRQSHLNTHMKNHSNIQHFKCDVCNTSFYQKDALRNHIYIHHSNRQFKCNKCGRIFKSSSNLWNHQFTHTNARPFKCDICNAGFKRNSTLTKHKKTHTKKQPHQANKESSKISSRKFTSDRNPGQPEPGHNNKKSFESSHRNASFTSTTTPNQHIKPETHTTHSETELTTPDDVSTTNQLPSMSDQPSTSDIYANKSQDQEEYGKYREHKKTTLLSNEFIDTCPITSEPGSCEHYDDLCLDQEMPEAIFPDKQDADACYLTSQLHSAVDWLLTSGIYVNKSQDQEKYEEIIKKLDDDYFQTSHPPQPFWEINYPSGDCDDDDFLCP